MNSNDRTKFISASDSLVADRSLSNWLRLQLVACLRTRLSLLLGEVALQRNGYLLRAL